MGLPDPGLMASLSEEWDQLAGHPWAGRSRPLVVQGQTLVVEADSPSLVAFLRYAEKALVEAITTRFGEGVIHSVEVRPPARG